MFPSDLVAFIDSFANTAYFPKRPGSTRTLRSKESVVPMCSTPMTSRGLCCESLGAPEDRPVASTVRVPLAALGTPPFHAVF